MRLRPIALFAFLVSSGCGASTSAPPMPTTTTAPLTSSLCGAPGRPCRCAETGETLGDVPAGKKRYEIRLSQVSDTESAVTLGGIGTLMRPSGQQGDRCFYVDLGAGQSVPVTVHARGARRDRGMAIDFSIREYDPRSSRFYTIVSQQCGDATSVCPFDDAGDWSQDYGRSRGSWDPCSSTRVESYHAEGGFYDRHATDVDVSFSLKVYQFVPRRQPGEEGCGGAT